MLEKKYTFNNKEFEDIWQDAHAFREDYDLKDDVFVIDTPPPTVSGKLHMGHIFSYCHTDFIARYQRMRGKNVFYPMGFDNNGLPTERLVEKNKKIRAKDLSRDEFRRICMECSDESIKEFRNLFNLIGLSVDWNLEYQTISDRVCKLSQMSFLDLYKKGRIYRKMEPILWDAVDQTAISQAEIEDKDHESHMNYISFKLDGGDKNLEIATTRPELLLACVAVFYHPDDNRYNIYKNKCAITPLFGARVPILPSELVKIEKGTGLVMCCTFGDELDVQWWREHSLQTRMMINKYGKIEVDASGERINFMFLDNDDSFIDKEQCVDIKKSCAFAKEICGLKIKQAREKMIDLLDENGFLIKREKIVHSVKCAERSGSALEILPTYQWYVKILDIKDQLLEKANECVWHPTHMKIKIVQWIEGLKWDWCISRQRYFGVQIPVWHVDGEEIVASADEMPINPLESPPHGYEYKEKIAECAFIGIRISDGKEVKIIAEKDVMDTWATSSVSPQINSGRLNDDYGIDSSERHNALYPADLRPQAHEIIRTWAFYTIVKSYLHSDLLPWKNVMISGWCLSDDKTKMSKSKGNIIEPMSLMWQKTPDVIRYWASTAHLGADTCCSEDVIGVGKRLVNKIWNAAKFCEMHFQNMNGARDESQIKEAMDLWILSKLRSTTKQVEEYFEKFDYCNARDVIEKFFWQDFCDNYMEFVKRRAYDKDASALNALHVVFEAIMKLFAPFLPYIIEKLYQSLFAHENSSIHRRGSWISYKEVLYDEQCINMGDVAVDIMDVVRKVKAEKKVSIKYQVKCIYIQRKDLEDEEEYLAPIIEDLKNVSSCENVAFSSTKDETHGIVQDKYQIFVELAENA